MKKQRIPAFLLAFLLIFLLPVTALAAEGDAAAELDYVTDVAGLLTPQERSSLDEQAARISRTYSCGVYILLLDDYTFYSSGDDVQDSCVEIYKDYHLGWGENLDGVMLMLSMAERDYYILVRGEGANRIFAGSALDDAETQMLSGFGNGDYNTGCRNFLSGIESVLADPPASGGSGSEDVQPGSMPAVSFTDVLLRVILPAAVIAGLVCLGLYLPMRTARNKNDADEYMVPGSMELREKSDRFTHRTETRRPRETDNDRDSGSSGGSEVTSGRGGKF